MNAVISTGHWLQCYLTPGQEHHPPGLEKAVQGPAGLSWQLPLLRWETLTRPAPSRTLQASSQHDPQASSQQNLQASRTHRQWPATSRTHRSVASRTHRPTASSQQDPQSCWPWTSGSCWELTMVCGSCWSVEPAGHGTWGLLATSLRWLDVPDSTTSISYINQVGMDGDLILWFNGPLDWTCPPGLRLAALPWWRSIHPPLSLRSSAHIWNNLLLSYVMSIDGMINRQLLYMNHCFFFCISAEGPMNWMEEFAVMAFCSLQYGNESVDKWV